MSNTTIFNNTREIAMLGKEVKRLNGEVFCIKHGCTSANKGFWVLLCRDNGGNVKKRFVEMYNRLYSPSFNSEQDELPLLINMQESLNQLFSSVQAALKIPVEGKMLYAPAIWWLSKTANAEEDDGMVAQAHAAYQTWKDASTEYSSWYDYYNAGLEEFCIAENYIQAAICGILRQKQRLEEAGLWRDAENQVKVLRKII